MNPKEGFNHKSNLTSSTLGLFLAPPPVLLFSKFKNHQHGWCLLLLLIVSLGWVYIYGSFIFYHDEHIADLIAQNKDLPKGCDSDGASGLATMFFGWLLAFTQHAPSIIQDLI